MKILIKKIKNYKGKTIISFVTLFLVFICIISLCIQPSIADNSDNFKGWTDYNKESAWTVYSLTDWGKLDGINFSKDGSFSKASVTQKFRDLYEPAVKKVLSGKNVPNGLYSSKEYKELILAILSTLDDKGIVTGGYNAYKTETKIFNDESFYNWKRAKLSSTYGIVRYEEVTKENEEAILNIYKKYINAETIFVKKYGAGNDKVTIYDPDNRLGTIIQAIIYSDKYLDKHDEYSEKDAKKFYDSNKEKTLCSQEVNDFAKEVLKIFSGVSAEGHTVIG